MVIKQEAEPTSTEFYYENAKYIRVRGAREHNLKNIDIDLPRDKFIVITGVSGSGKSSLAIDTIFAEGQRRFLESLSSYARQFVGKLEKPQVEKISGLSPSICIDQKTTSSNPRSTVGTVTEIYDYLRVLYSIIGKPHCPKCRIEILPLSSQEIIEKVSIDFENEKILILSPVVRERKGHYKTLFTDLIKQGFIYAYIDGKYVDLTEREIELDPKRKHSIEVVIDQLKVTENNKERISEAIEMALRLSDGYVIIEKHSLETEVKDRFLFSENGSCPKCGTPAPELEPRLFSFNAPQGACPTCMGLGTVMEVDPDLLIPNKNKSIKEGAIIAISRSTDSWSYKIIEALAKEYGFRTDVPIKDLPSKALEVLLYGSDRPIKINISSDKENGGFSFNGIRKTEGIINMIKRRYRQTKSNAMREYYESFMSDAPCPTCNGRRLNESALSVYIAGKNISHINEMSIANALSFISSLPSQLTKKEKFIAEQVIRELKTRLSFLVDVGLGYLTLNRKASTLSGGEAQRIRLATQVGSKLVGVLYVLDEPSIGLHARDTDRLIRTFYELRDLGNTVIVVEHDEQTIRAADYIVDMGPGAGLHGGEVVAQGSIKEIIHHPESLTGKYLRGELKIPVPKKRRSPKKWLELKGINHNNLRDLNIKIPLGVFVAVTGVSGSGKSSLVEEILWKALARYFYKSREKPGKFKEIIGLENIDRVVLIDQSPIGRTPRSTPATYTKVFDHIRNLFASLPESKKKGYKPGRFSFNVKQGRCEACEGNGYVKVELHFLPDVYVECDVCHGKRYNEETLKIRYKGKNISEVLDMTVDEALIFFDSIPSIKRILQTLSDVGCGYLKLGQSSLTLSGGEAQRIKLSRELAKRQTGNTLILMDEPTTGLHFHDVKRLLDVIHRIVDNGNTVLVIEHNMDIIKNADYIIDLGPEGGEEGGKIVAQGTPEKVIKNKDSYTGKYLQNVLEKI